MFNRRSLITGLVSLVAAPAIVRAGSLMPVKAMLPPEIDFYFTVPLFWAEVDLSMGLRLKGIEYLT